MVSVKSETSLPIGTPYNFSGQIEKHLRESECLLSKECFRNFLFFFRIHSKFFTHSFSCNSLSSETKCLW